MAYARTTWVDGSDPAITAARLNKIEKGIEDAHGGSLNAGAIGTAELADNAVTTAKLANNVVTNAKLRDSAGLSVLGRSATLAGDPADIVAASDGLVLRRAGNTVGFGQVSTDGIANLSVTGAKLADGAVTNAKLGNNSVSTARLGDGAVTAVKLASHSVTAIKIAGKAVTLAKMADVPANTVIGGSSGGGTPVAIGPASANGGVLTGRGGALHFSLATSRDTVFAIAAVSVSTGGAIAFQYKDDRFTTVNRLSVGRYEVHHAAANMHLRMVTTVTPGTGNALNHRTATVRHEFCTSTMTHIDIRDLDGVKDSHFVLMIAPGIG